MSKTTIKEFTHDDLNIISDDVIYQGFFTLKRIRFTHKLFAGGESGIVTRTPCKRASFSCYCL